jgi:hypothetical protein
MVIPNLVKMDSVVRSAVDYLISQEYMFTCWDITRQLSHHYGKPADHNAVRSAVEKYFFSAPNYITDGFKNGSGYNREVTYTIHGAPQVYKPFKTSVASYDKDFLDPLRVEAPPKPSLYDKLKKVMNTVGKKDEELVRVFKEYLKENSLESPQPVKATVPVVSTVYVVKDTKNGVYAGTKTSSGKRRWVKNLSDANFYGTKYRTAALIKANPDRVLEPVAFNLS